jgi:hypothetical protein
LILIPRIENKNHDLVVVKDTEVDITQEDTADIPVEAIWVVGAEVSKIPPAVKSMLAMYPHSQTSTNHSFRIKPAGRTLKTISAVQVRLPLYVI